MRKSMVLSVLGHDSPGLVEKLSKLIVAHQGQWVESRMASLAGQFAGILRVDIPSENVADFQKTLNQSDSLGLKVIFEECGTSQSQKHNEVKIELIGQDQPGIVHRISSELAKLNASVDELHTEVVEASMSGELLFKASLNIHIPQQTSTATIREVLEDLANELIVDIELLEDH